MEIEYFTQHSSIFPIFSLFFLFFRIFFFKHKRNSKRQPLDFSHSPGYKFSSTRTIHLRGCWGSCCQRCSSQQQFGRQQSKLLSYTTSGSVLGPLVVWVHFKNGSVYIRKLSSKYIILYYIHLLRWCIWIYIILNNCKRQQFYHNYIWHFSSKLAFKKFFFLNIYFLGCRLRMWNPFLAVGIGKPFFGIIKNIWKIISCSITNLTEPKIT